MAKKQTFADKAKKVKNLKHCPVCNTPLTPTLFLIPERTAKGSYKYKKKIISICKCNYNEYYG